MKINVEEVGEMPMLSKLKHFIRDFNEQLAGNERFRANPKSSEIRNEVVDGVLRPLACGFDKAVAENDVNKIMKYALMMYRTVYHEFRRIKYYGSGLPYDCFISQSTETPPSLHEVGQSLLFLSPLVQLELDLDFPGKLVEFRKALQVEMRSSDSVQEELINCLDNVPTGASLQLVLPGDWKSVNRSRSRHDLLDKYLDENGHVKEERRVIKRGPGYGFWTARTCLKSSYKLEIERDNVCQGGLTL